MIVSFKLHGAQPRCELIDVSKFIRLSIESFPKLEGSQTLEAFKNVCSGARKSEEYVLIISAENQWVRTVIVRRNLHSEPWIDPSISDCIIQSNTLLYYPYWSQLRDEANTRVHFPSGMLEEAFFERRSLESKLKEWMDSGEDCKIGMHKRGPQSTSETRFWEIRDADASADVEFEEWIVPDCISRVIWRGGRFVRKETLQDSASREFEVVKRVRSHPNIVYGFGELICEDTENSAYFMEYMSNDLCDCIVENIRFSADKPPFSPSEALDILLQFAKAMKHMHQEGVNVVHCDLKLQNILITKIATSENASHYLVKVADFGSARYWPWGKSGAESASFKAGDPTTRYAAPEVLRQLKDRTFPICHPDKIDVYSFGIVAFEVITGESILELFNSMGPSAYKKGVIEGTWRPPLLKECEKSEKFIQDSELLKLIETCWDGESARRPSFVTICKDLNNAKVRILV